MFAPVESSAPPAFSESATLAGDTAAWSQAAGAAASAGTTGAQGPIGPGSVVANRYEILKELGEGGMGAVYKARDRELDRLVALKVIRPELARHAEILQRFKRELILARQVTHRNVIRIFDLGVTGNTKFITMEYVEGQDLKTLLRQQKFTTEQAVDIFCQVCRGLEAAHAENVIHRDLKPQNIMLDQQGKVLVMDFGLAHSVEEHGMTQTGALMGTPDYMSPEQAKGAKADSRSDLFSLGIIFYELLTGKLPFTSDSLLGTLVARTQQRAKPVREIDPQIPQVVSDIVSKCLATDAAQRYQTAGELLADLETWQKGVKGQTIRVPKSPRLAMVAPSVAWKWITLSVTTACVLLGLTWFVFRDSLRLRPAVKPKPMTVLVGDLNNTTGEPVFTGTLEHMLTLSLEGASFLTAYDRGQAHTLGRQLQPGATKLDEPVARLVAVREGVNVIIAGSVGRQGSGYKISLRAVDAVTGKPLVMRTVEVGNKEGVSSAIGELAAAIRRALGDDTPESLQLAAAETFSAASLEAAHSYAMGQDAQYLGKQEDSIPNYLKAVELDPNFGRAYASLTAVYANLGQREEAEKYYQLAMAHIDRMTERERYRARGTYYLMMRNPVKAIDEFSTLLKQYPADTGGLTNLPLAYFYRRDMARALQEGRHATEAYPSKLLYRSNMALYAMYAGDFQTAAREASAVLEKSSNYVLPLVALALSQLALGQPAESEKTYQRLSGTSVRGASYAASGLADLAVFEGRVDDAVGVLEKGVEADVANNKSTVAATKLAALAEAHLLRGRKAKALEAADRAAALSKNENVQCALARVYVEAGQVAKAHELASGLAARLEPDPQAYAKIIEGEIRLKTGKAREAIQLFQDARNLSDTWLGRFDLGRAYVEAGAFTEAFSELDACMKRRGEATAIFLDDVPSYRYMPPVYYYLGRAQQGLKSPAAAEAYRTFIAIKQKGGQDPLLADARKRGGA